jgi:SAM-dependent methyltransferase
MKKIGKDVSAAQYWADQGSEYHSAITNPYHRHRLSVVRSMIPPAVGVLLDFGCGDGVMFSDFPKATCIGIEPDSGLLEQAKGQFPTARLLHGSVEKLREIESSSVDLVLCLNVLAYMTDEEDATFYGECARVLKSGGSLLVTHSNELFDLFSLNSYTVDLFQRYFGCDPSPMLVNPTKPDHATYNIRENPLTYSRKLSSYGFREEEQAFINWHEQPPMMGKDDKKLRDTLNVSEDQKWTLLFRCSTFASLSRKVRV